METLTITEVIKKLKMSKDNTGRWCASSETPDFAKKYLSNYREPSRKWPYSHLRAVQTKKFKKIYDQEMGLSQLNT